jgi:hypothetical protein
MKNIHLIIACTMVQFSVCAAVAAGQEADELWSDVQNLVSSLKGGYQPIDDKQLAVAKKNVLAATAVAAKQLDGLPEEEAQPRAEALQWQSFVKAVAESTPDLAELNETLIGLYADSDGLEADHWLDLRSKLERYMYLSQFAADKDAAKGYEEKVTELSEAVTTATTEPRGPATIRIGRLLGWFDQHDQQPEAIGKIRDHFSQPNLVLTVSERMANKAASRHINRTLPVKENILGTKIRGTATTTGDITIKLLPDPNQIAAQVLLTGTASSENTGWNRGVRIRSEGTTSIQASKPVFFDKNGISTGRTLVDCSTSTHIKSINADRQIVEKIAWKKACKSKSEAECIANQLAEARVRQEIDDEVISLVLENRQKFEKDIRNPMLRRNATPRSFLTSTEPERIWLRMLQANSFQLSAFAEAPVDLPATDVAVQVHESFVANLSEGLIGGITLTDEGIAEKIAESGREVPDELKIRDGTDPWSITFSMSRPVSVNFDRDAVLIVVRGSRFTRGSQTVTRDMQISARYKIERTASGLRLIRDGDVNAEYVKQRAESIGDIAVKTLMGTKFAAVFKEEFETTGIQLPGPLAGKAELSLNSFDLGSGWAVIGWNLVDIATEVTASVD